MVGKQRGDLPSKFDSNDTDMDMMDTSDEETKHEDSADSEKLKLMDVKNKNVQYEKPCT